LDYSLFFVAKLQKVDENSKFMRSFLSKLLIFANLVAILKGFCTFAK